MAGKWNWHPGVWLVNTKLHYIIQESDSIPAVASSELRRPSTVDRRISVDVTDAVVVHQIFRCVQQCVLIERFCRLITCRDKLVEPGEAEIMHELHRHENLVI